MISMWISGIYRLSQNRLWHWKWKCLDGRAHPQSVQNQTWASFCRHWYWCWNGWAIILHWLTVNIIAHNPSNRLRYKACQILLNNLDEVTSKETLTDILVWSSWQPNFRQLLKSYSWTNIIGFQVVVFA